MKIDLHVHTAYSFDATGTPEESLERALEAGLDGIAITEHHSFDNAEIFLTLAPRYGLVAFVGAEVPTLTGHYLVFSENIGQWNSYSRLLCNAQDLIHKVNLAGGAAIAAHPFRFSGLGYGGAAVKKLQGLAAIEVYNGGNNGEENKSARELARMMNLPGTGGSDAHRVEEIGRGYTVFEHPVRTITELVKALKSGHFTSKIGV